MATAQNGYLMRKSYLEDEGIQECYYLNGAPAYKQAIILLWRVNGRWQAILPN